MLRLADLERLALRRLPQPITHSLQRLKRALPFRLQQAPPVVQMYVNDGLTRSYVGVHNFFSCALPEAVAGAVAELAFYDQDGRVLLRHRERLGHFGARAVDVAALFGSRGVDAPYGVVTVQVTPDHPRLPAFRELGRFASHFFVFFRDAGGSVAQTHPLSMAGPDNAPAGRFISNQVVSAARLEELVLFQYNPSHEVRSFEHQLLDLRDGRVVARVARRLAPLGSCRTAFPSTGLGDVASLRVCVDPLPGPNAKPILRRVFVGGLYSMSHA